MTNPKMTTEQMIDWIDRLALTVTFDKEQGLTDIGNRSSDEIVAIHAFLSYTKPLLEAVEKVDKEDALWCIKDYSGGTWERIRGLLNSLPDEEKP